MSNNSDWHEIEGLGFVQNGAEKIAKKFYKQANIDAKYDLHGLNGNECHSMIQDIISNEWDKGHRIILLIHGFGQNILKNIIFDYCYEHPLLLACLCAPQKLGGSGATLLLYKRRRSID